MLTRETAFALLSPKVRGILARAGIESPTAPQERAIPKIVENRGVLVISPTGSGKTEAALLPVLDRLAVRPDDDGRIQ